MDKKTIIDLIQSIGIILLVLGGFILACKGSTTSVNVEVKSKGDENESEDEV